MGNVATQEKKIVACPLGRLYDRKLRNAYFALNAQRRLLDLEGRIQEEGLVKHEVLEGWTVEKRHPRSMTPAEFMSPNIRGSPQVKMLIMLSKFLATESADYHTIFQLLKDYRPDVIELSAKKELQRFKFIIEKYLELRAENETCGAAFKKEFDAEMKRLWNEDKQGFLLLHEPVPETVREIRELLGGEHGFMVYYFTSGSPRFVDELLRFWKAGNGKSLLKEEVGYPLEDEETPKPAEAGAASPLEAALRKAATFGVHAGISGIVEAVRGIDWGTQVGAGAPAAVEAEAPKIVEHNTVISLERMLFLKADKYEEKLAQLRSLAEREGITASSIYVIDDRYRPVDVNELAKSGFRQFYVTDGSESPFERTAAGIDNKITQVNSWELAKAFRTIINTQGAVDLF